MITLYRFLALLGLLSFLPLLSGCYYSPDIRGQTIGSAIGTVGTGTALLYAGATISGLGAGVIGGSIIGGIIGQEYDTRRFAMQQRPIGSPIPLYHYQTYRPLFTIDCFRPGKVLLPSSVPAPKTGVNCAQQ